MALWIMFAAGFNAGAWAVVLVQRWWPERKPRRTAAEVTYVLEPSGPPPPGPITSPAAYQRHKAELLRRHPEVFP